MSETPPAPSPPPGPGEGTPAGDLRPTSGGAPGGGPPSTPAPAPGTPGAPPPDEAAVGDLLWERFVPGAGNVAPRKRRTVGALVLAGAALGTVLGLAAGFAFDQSTTKPRVRAEQDAEEELDQEEAPFTGTIDYDTSVPYTWRIVLDRTLTADEVATLQSIPSTSNGVGERVWALLKPRGARLLRFPSTLPDTTPGYSTVSAYWSDATVFNLNLFSKRNSQLSVVGMKAVTTDCRRPSARTVIEYPPQGEATNTGVLFDLTADGPGGPLVTDEGKDQGQPYFTRRRIDLGGSSSPGGLRVEAMVRGRSCAWKIKARYRDSTGTRGEVTLGDGKKPFFAEAVPAHPEQYWVYSVGDPEQTWIPCHEKPSVPACKARTEANAAPAGE